MPKKKSLYDRQASLQKENPETSGEVKNQNEHHNAKKEALGSNTKR